MASDKRSFVDFENFPGSINQDKNLYMFPTLYKTTDSGKVRKWTIYVRLIKRDSMDKKETKKQNWELMTEVEVSIKTKYLVDGEKISDGNIAQIWTESGVIDMKNSRSAASYIEPKNVGKKNERNTLQQALVEARGKFLKKKDEGGVEELTNLAKELKITNSTKFYPMLAKKYPDFIKKIKYPVFIQPKLDGDRCIAFLDSVKEPTFNNVVLYSRQQKEYPSNPPNDKIRASLLEILKDNYNDKNESLYLDGELYKHDVDLQDINSVIRGKSLSGEIMQYHVYDHFYPSYDAETFKDRNKILKGIYNGMDSKDKEFIKLVETKLVNSEQECDEEYVEFLDKKYEGIMIRNPEGPYLKSATKKSEQLRSKDLLKRKMIFDEEFEVVDYTEGTKGKDVGAVVWICESKNKAKDTFNAVPNLPYEDRYKIFKECKKKFASKYEGRMINVEFRGLSKDGIPLQAKAIEFRDYE